LNVVWNQFQYFHSLLHITSTTPKAGDCNDLLFLITSHCQEQSNEAIFSMIYYRLLVLLSSVCSFCHAEQRRNLPERFSHISTGSEWNFLLYWEWHNLNQILKIYH